MVTGGLGFIGSHIIDKLCEERYEVVSADTKSAQDFSFARFGEAHYYVCDVSSLSSVKELFKVVNPDFVIHCAAQARIQKGIDSPVETFMANVLGTLNILESAKEFDVKKVVYSASSSAYGLQNSLPLVETMPPMTLNPYSLFKEFGERLCWQYSRYYELPTISLRYFNVYGPRQPLEGLYSTVIVKFLHQWKNRQPFTIVPNGKQSRDFTYVSDVVNANVAAMKARTGRGYDGEVFNVGNGKNYTIFQLAKLIGGPDYPTVFIDRRRGESCHSCADIYKAKNKLKWRPEVSLPEGIKMFKKHIMC